MTKRTDAPSAAIRIRAMKRDRFQCTYCGVPGTDAELEIDHIIPVSNGGSHHISNLTTACRKCNQEKGSKDIEPSHTSGRRFFTGLFLHTLDPIHREIHYQGQIVREDGDSVLVQLFSWLTGCPTNCEVMSKDMILSDLCVLYQDAESWRSGAERLEAAAEPARRERWRAKAQQLEAVL